MIGSMISMMNSFHFPLMMGIPKDVDIYKPNLVLVFIILFSIVFHPSTCYGDQVQRPILPSSFEVQKAFERHNIISDGIIPKPPEKFMVVKFRNNCTLELGNVLLFDEAWEIPGFIFWNAEPGCFHTLMFLNIDHPNDDFPKKRQYLHWLVGNIPEALVENGRILSSYLMPIPPPTQYGTHRLLFLAFKQPRTLIQFNEPFMPALPLPKTRANWTVEGFVKKYGLIGPVAGNFYKIDWQNEVNHLKYEVEPKS